MKHPEALPHYEREFSTGRSLDGPAALQASARGDEGQGRPPKAMDRLPAKERQRTSSTAPRFRGAGGDIGYRDRSSNRYGVQICP